MNSLKQIRELFNISQHQLADYLGVSRTLFSMVETRRRSLPTAALVKLGHLEISLQQHLLYKPDDPNSDNNLAAMCTYAKNCAYAAIAARRKLEKLQKDYQRCMQVLAAVSYLQKPAIRKNESKLEPLWLELLKSQTLKQLKKCGQAAQAKMQLKALALEMQATQAGAMKF